MVSTRNSFLGHEATCCRSNFQQRQRILFMSAFQSAMISGVVGRGIISMRHSCSIRATQETVVSHPVSALQITWCRRSQQQYLPPRVREGASHLSSLPVRFSEVLFSLVMRKVSHLHPQYLWKSACHLPQWSLSNYISGSLNDISWGEMFEQFTSAKIMLMDVIHSKEPGILKVQSLHVVNPHSK